MTLTCPQCKALTIKKNGSIHNGKQKYECLSCHKQFVEGPQHKQISNENKERIRRSLLERVSLEGICRIFDVSLTWLLAFMQETFEQLPDNLNATVVADNEEFEVVVLEADELWSYVGNKKNQQWLWLVMHSKSRQIVAFHVGDRSKTSGQALMAKLPEDLKKKPSFTQITSQLMEKLSPSSSTSPSVKGLGKQVILRDLTARYDKDVPDS
jgi:hypothetical protein